MPLNTKPNVFLADMPNLGEGEMLWTYPYDIRSGFNADTVMLVSGRGIIHTANSDRIGGTAGLIYPTTGTVGLRGIIYTPQDTEARPGFNVDSATGVLGYPARSTANPVGSNITNALTLVPFMVSGIIGVRVDAAVTPDSPVFCRIAGGLVGSFRGAADATPANTFAVTNAEFLKSANANGVVPLWLKPRTT